MCVGAGVKDGGVLVGLKVGLGPGVDVKDENETVGRLEESSGGTVDVFIGPTVKVGMVDTVNATEVRNATDTAVLFTSVMLIVGATGITCIPQATSATVKMI